MPSDLREHDEYFGNVIVNWEMI